MISLNKNKNNQRIYFILAAGFILRTVYLLFFAEKVLGAGTYINGDTPGWTESFKNLLTYGEYTFDRSNPEASFGRVPGFSFFWGIHYLIFGEAYVYKAVAFTHLVLDTLCIYLLYLITIRISKNELAGLLAALIYCCYPFVFFWLSISYSEIFSNTLNLLFFALLLKENKTTGQLILLGLLSAACFLTREFIGLNILAGLLYLFFLEDKKSWKEAFMRCAIFVTAFMSLYIWWPVRNYFLHDRLVLTRTMGGFVLYGEDYQAFRNWIGCWDNDETIWLEKVQTDSSRVDFPAEAYTNPVDVFKVDSLIRLARTCGSSFYLRKGSPPGVLYNGKALSLTNNCNEPIRIGFEALTKEFMQKRPWDFWTVAPLRNLKKALLKTELKKGSMATGASKMTKYLFGYRSFLLFAALAGIFISMRNKGIYPILLFVALIVFFFCFIFRFMEMKNLLQTDILLISFSAFFFARILKRFVNFNA
ncbi:MAG TPA: glycosyltransferase family 39 protein [Cytophagaceae bacterium]|nr:glycosyltransferase family 39 protein [Cytophagaceae bacterium]